MFYEASANGKRRISVFSKFLPLSQNKKSTVKKEDPPRHCLLLQ